MPNWMRDLEDIGINGDQKSDYILYHLDGSYKSRRQLMPTFVSVNLGKAAKFMTYLESINSLKASDVTLDDVGEYIDYINQHCKAIKVRGGIKNKKNLLVENFH